jgi:hydrogenase expression/formation protein HypC
VCLAVPGEVIAIGERDALPFGRVRFGSVEREVCLAYVPEAAPGDFVLVHVGFAIQRLDRAAAEATLALFAGAARAEDEGTRAARTGAASGVDGGDDGGSGGGEGDDGGSGGGGGGEARGGAA